MFWKFGHSDLEFVSDFEIRISDFHPGYAGGKSFR